MIIQGKYNTAIIYTERIEESAIRQIQAMCDSPVFEGTKLRMMPDVHTGKSCTIGTTMEIREAIVPNMVGVDIGCGMYVAVLSEKEGEIVCKMVDDFINQNIPAEIGRASCRERVSPRV